MPEPYMATDATGDSGLNRVTKILQDFENPQISEEKVSGTLKKC